MESLLKLQNGSDVRGVAIALEGGAPVNLTPAIVGRIAWAFALWLAERKDKEPQALKLGVGHDSRLSAEALKIGALEGILSTGAAAYDCAMASTPAMFCSTIYPETAFDGAIMLTASHLPMERNGMKFFTAEGGLDKPDIKALLTLAETLPEPQPIGRAEWFALLPLYARTLRDRMKASINAEDYELPLEGLHVVLDAGNGAGGFFAEEVLALLGANIAGSQFLEPDGHFPNHIPNPENKAAMQSIQGATVGNRADLGIIFDTDVDRMSAVLPDGSEINRDAIIAMMAAILAPEYPGSTIVTDSVTSDRLTRFLEGELGLVHHRFQRGYKNVINESIRLNQAGIISPLAIETSGHGALSENHFLDDGAYLAVRLLIAAAIAKRENRSLGALIAALPPACEEAERRIPIRGEAFAALGKAALDDFAERAEARGYAIAPNSYEGVRLTLPEGWMLLRLSLHDPLLPLNVEGNAPGDAARLLAIAKELLAGHEALDLTVLS